MDGNDLGLKLKGSTRMTSGSVPIGYAQKKLLKNGLFRTYHGTNVSNARKIVETGFKPEPRAKYDKGFYTSPSLEMVERLYAQEFTHKGRLTRSFYRIQRVNPDRLKVIRAWETLAGADYWLFPERDIPRKVDVRPCGVLIRETGHVQEQDESEEEPIREKGNVQEQRL